MGNRAILILAGLGLAGVSSWFALGSDTVVKWNDRVVAITGEFDRHAEQFVPHLKPWASGARMDIESFGKIDEAFDSFAQKTRETAERVKTTRPPDDPLCKDFHAALVEFAELQVRQLDGMSQAVDLMRKYNQPSPDELKTVASRLDAMGAESAALIQKANHKQAAMAKKFRVKILNGKPS